MVHTPFSSAPSPALGLNTITLGPLPSSSRTLNALARQGMLGTLRVCDDLDGVTAAAREGGVDLVVCEVIGAECEGLLLPARLLSDAGKHDAHGMPMVLWISDLPECALNAYAAGLREEGAVIEIAPGPGAIAQALVRCASQPHLPAARKASAPRYSDEELIMALGGAQDMRIVLQPQVELASGKIIGAEALARWRHPSAGDIPPGDFVQAISRLSMAPMLFHFVTERVLDMQAQLVRMGVFKRVSVNASVSTLAMPDVVSSLEARTLRRGISPTLITIEITEDETLADKEALEIELGRLRACGFGISMDDFGTGASTLERLTRLPFDEIKIDRSFVQRVTSDPTAHAVVSAALRLGVELGLTVVAEGIETAEQALQLRALGGCIGQGYGLGKPMEVDAYLRKVQPLSASGVAESGCKGVAAQNSPVHAAGTVQVVSVPCAGAFAAEMMPVSKANRNRSASRSMPSFLIALDFCELIVCLERFNCAAISLTDMPDTNSRTTSSSRLVRSGPRRASRVRPVMPPSADSLGK